MSDREDFQMSLAARGETPETSEAGGLASARGTPRSAFLGGNLDREEAINQILGRIAALAPDSPVPAMIARKLY